MVDHIRFLFLNMIFLGKLEGLKFFSAATVCMYANWDYFNINIILILVWYYYNIKRHFKILINFIRASALHSFSLSHGGYWFSIGSSQQVHAWIIFHGKQHSRSLAVLQGAEAARRIWEAAGNVCGCCWGTTASPNLG